MENLVKRGKTKALLRGEGGLLMRFCDDLTALDGKRHDILEGKGRINAEICYVLFKELESKGIRTHLIDFVPPDSLLVEELRMVPLEVVCRRLAAGSFVRRYPFVEKGKLLEPPVVEFFYKSDELGDPYMADDTVIALGVLSEEEVRFVKETTRRICRVLAEFLSQRGLELVDFKVEYGRDESGNLVLGDELTPDSMRLWDRETGESLDKDPYREGKDLKFVRRVYEEVHRRICHGRL